MMKTVTTKEWNHDLSRFPPPPQDVYCSKCNRTVVVAVNPGQPGIESDCSDTNSPIAHDPDHQPNGADGILICFSEEHPDA